MYYNKLPGKIEIFSFFLLTITGIFYILAYQQVEPSDYILRVTLTSSPESEEGMPKSAATAGSKAKKKGKRKGRLSTPEARREYQRRYYQMHKEKAKEYQRQYNLTHKKKARGGRGKANFVCPREVVRATFNTSDIMHAPVEKTLKILEKIISGERLFTM